MLYTATSYLSFLANSTNAHGVHSPFVYNYLTRCLYQRPKRSRNTIVDLVLRSIAYFRFTNLRIEGNSGLQKLLESETSVIRSENAPIDLLYFENVEQVRTEDAFSRFTLHNDSLIVIANINKSKNYFKAWEALIQHPGITVSIDLFCCGLLFIRKEQVKQHFYIRL